ncbi:MAG TPA: SPFH domain-containing protein [Dehalococcoidia bacterium]|nr:SPFH domain-containing protein [Dehalococcoidia bacterium]
MPILAAIIIGALFLLFLFLVIAGSMVVVINGQQVGIMERRYFGRALPPGRVVAMRGEIGYQARVLQPGLTFLIPFLYSVHKEQMVTITEEEIGLVESIDGQSLEPGRIFARHVNGHDSYQDGESFLTNGGQKGPQVDFLSPGKYRINLYLFHVRTLPALRIQPGFVGLVGARDGDPMTAGRLLAKKVEGHRGYQDGEIFLRNGGQRGPQIEVLQPGQYRINTDLFEVEVKPATIVQANQIGLVTANDGQPLPGGELVAKSVQGHSDFQDASAFLEAGGERGPQFDLMKPGTYYINPLMFSVKLDEVAIVERGEVAVLVSNVGAEPESMPADLRLEVGQERYVVPAGYRGIQAEVAGPGVYYLNRWAYIPYIIPTTNLTIDWAEEEQSSEEQKTGQIQRLQLFNPLSVISRDGFEMRVSVKVVIRVRPDQAPLMVAKIGSIENLIDHVIHPMIDSSFRNQASSTQAMNFMQDRALEQSKAEERARGELEKYHCECVSVLISQIILPEELMEIQTRRVIAAQQQEMYVEQQKAEQKRIATDNTRAKADRQPDLVAAQIGVQIAEQTKQRTIIEAEGRARAVQVEGEAEGTRILAVGTATAEAYEKQVAAVGQLNLAGIEVTKAIAAAHLKITPDIMVGGGGPDGNNNVFSAFIAQLLQSGRPAIAAPASGDNGQPAGQG